jgi:PAS domain S-box-containing protein
MSLSNEHFAAVFRFAPDGMLLVDSEGRIIEANPEAHRLFGFEEGALDGRSVEELVPVAARSRHVANRERFHGQSRRRSMGAGSELEALHADGHTFPVEISLSPIEIEGTRHVVATVRDITTRRRLRNFGIGALRAAEEERARIARELHDETAQELATHLVRLTLLERAPDEASRTKALEELRAGLQHTVEGVRRVARGLRPPELEDAGLLAAIQAHTRSVSQARAVEVDVAPFAGVDDAFTEDGLLAIYRIVQEALSNAVRHGRAARVEIVIERRDEHVLVTVTDDGSGFEPMRVDAGESGLGLLGMRERAAMLEGHLEVETAPGAGTRVRASLPVQIDRTRPAGPEVERV